MRATLVRFGPELYVELQAEAKRSGVSVAQYVREAVVARIAYTAGRRGDPGYLPARDEREIARAAAAKARADAGGLREGARALRAEGEQARRVSSARKSKTAG
jgi:hypothetical protein